MTQTTKSSGKAGHENGSNGHAAPGEVAVARDEGMTVGAGESQQTGGNPIAHILSMTPTERKGMIMRWAQTLGGIVAEMAAVRTLTATEREHSGGKWKNDEAEANIKLFHATRTRSESFAERQADDSMKAFDVEGAVTNAQCCTLAKAAMGSGETVVRKLGDLVLELVTEMRSEAGPVFQIAEPLSARDSKLAEAIAESRAFNNKGAETRVRNKKLAVREAKKKANGIKVSQEK